MSNDIHKGLLGLPAELRNCIYGYVLPRGRIVILQEHWPWVSTSPCPPRAITQVSRQLRHETLPIYFHNNLFIMGYVLCKEEIDTAGAPFLKKWIEGRIPPGHTSFLKRVLMPWNRYWNGHGDHFHTGARLKCQCMRWWPTHESGIGIMIDLLYRLSEFMCMDLNQPFPIEALLRPLRKASRFPDPLLNELLQETRTRYSPVKWEEDDYDRVFLRHLRYDPHTNDYCERTYDGLVWKNRELVLPDDY